MGPAPTKHIQSIDLSINHPRFTNGKFIVNDKQRLMQTIIGVDNKQYDKWKQRLQKDKPNPQFLLLPVSEDFSSKGLCGNSGTLTLDFQDYPYLLTEQIAHRKGKKRLFQQSELWYLLFALISAKKDIIPAFTKIGDVRPQNIFINDKSQIKVANVFSWPRETTNFMKAFDNEVTYLAPQQLKQLDMGVAEGVKNDQSQLFSIGLTLLSAATLQDFLDAYDLKKFFINEGKINGKLKQFKLNRAYSDIFKGVVCNLCQFDESKRITAEELWDWISPHEQKIRERSNFFIPSAPNKIHQEVLEVRQFVSQVLGTSRESGGSSGQKLNFPHPIIRSTPVDSIVIPPTTINQYQNSPQPSTIKGTTIAYSSPSTQNNQQEGQYPVTSNKKVGDSSSNTVSPNVQASNIDPSSKKDANSKQDLESTPTK